MNRLTYIIIGLLILTTTLTSCHSSKKPTTEEAPKFETIHVDKPNIPQNRILEEAYTWLGTPYRYAGEEKGKGVDCSGMVMMVYYKVTGIKLPRNSAKQADYCKRIKASDAKPGDLVFFATGRDKNKISHVGIVIDDETFIHSSSSKGVVISKFSNDYYRRTLIMFGTVAQE